MQRKDAPATCRYCNEVNMNVSLYHSCLLGWYRERQPRPFFRDEVFSYLKWTLISLVK